MQGAFRIFSAWGIPVRLHWSFFFLIGWILISSQMRGEDWLYTAWSGLIVLSIFVCVVLHEFGHALTARRYGVETRDIILSPIGGIARLDRLPEKPMQEFFVAIAGPLVNIAIALLLIPILLIFFLEETQHLWALLTRNSNAGSGSDSFFNYYAPSIFYLNLILATFNLLPAFPMDGGRIFRALLSLRFDRTKATRIAARFGQFIAILLAIYGIWSFNIITIFIAAFVFFTAWQEYRSIFYEDILKSSFVEALTMPVTLPVYATTPVLEVLQAYQQEGGPNFIYTTENGIPLGAITKGTLQKVARQHKKTGAVPELKQLISPLPPLILSTQVLRQALELMHRSNASFLLVISENGQLIGTLESDHIYDYVRNLRKRSSPHVTETANSPS